MPNASLLAPERRNDEASERSAQPDARLSGVRDEVHRFKILLLISIMLLSAFGCAHRKNDGAVATEQAPGGSVLRSLTFLFFSDTQADPETGDYTALGELSAQAVTRFGDAKLVIFGGDSVNDGGDESEWQAFREAAAPLLDGKVTLSAAGNHDNNTLLAEQFDYPVTAPSDRGGRFFYSYYEDPVFFIVLDSNSMGAANAGDTQWLRNELESDAARQASWRVAVMHHPMWPAVDNPKDSQRAETMRANFLPLLRELGVELILCGHQHVYSRTLPMDGETAAATDGNGEAAAGGGGKEAAADGSGEAAAGGGGKEAAADGSGETAAGGGIVQIMAASGSKGSYPAGDRDYMASVGYAPNYLYLAAGDDMISIAVYDLFGSELDSIELTHRTKEQPGADGGVTNGSAAGGGSAPNGSAPNGSAPNGNTGNGDAYDSAGNGDVADGSHILVLNTAGERLWSFSEETLKARPSGTPETSAYVFSTINNWPVSRFYSAEGFRVEDILKCAGVYETAQIVTFRAADGYEVSLTRGQLFSVQSYYPHVGENDEGAQRVYPIIAYRWREGADDLNAIREDKPALIFGQRDCFEHTNPAFVVGVTEIIINEEPCETWRLASGFPLPGPIASGESVKLQHPEYGLVKLHYTLDGSDPTTLSPMYNPSTYQPELNRPITIGEAVTIKVLAVGYGKADSGIAVLDYSIAGVGS